MQKFFMGAGAAQAQADGKKGAAERYKERPTALPDSGAAKLVRSRGTAH
ncbi:hypothetical protein [Candidatus Desulfovibrio trichonymphae]|nr:hypothetical protein [Candidatus Desulfovibrio trichonymphae]GHU92911.1 hypothetical protein AGMMS49925_12250 [Deltaproteobacteria bacterium]